VADGLTLEIATPAKLAVAETVEEVVVPGTEGYFGVLPGHAPLLATVGVGELTYRQAGTEYQLALFGGFAEVRNDKVIILADTAERPHEIDRARAERARARAEARLAGRMGDVDYTRAMAALLRALARLMVANRGR
jgi:F-type H+-transporting ATPase subunit epsilon